MATVQPTRPDVGGVGAPFGPSGGSSALPPALAGLRHEPVVARPPISLPPEFARIARGAPTQLLANLQPREALAPPTDWIQRYGAKAHLLSWKKSLPPHLTAALTNYQRVVDDPHSRPVAG